MEFVKIFSALFLAVVLLASPASAQRGSDDALLKGIVWQEPADLQTAWGDLVRMRGMGIEAVRVAPIREERLLTLADSLGLRFFQEIPVARLPATRLVDTLGYAQRTLATLLQTARRHPSARTFGLARGSDTSDSTACGYFERLARFARQMGGPSVQVYYVTKFIEDDVCGETVDFVLLDVLGVDDPLAHVARWRAAHPDVPVGLASLGQWVDSDAARGLNLSGSPESQARYLEEHMRRVQVAAPDVQPVAMFVYRWRDILRELPSPAYDVENPYRHTFGLYTREGAERPAADVVAGIYGRGQHVFAFAAGRKTDRGYPTTTIAGWLVMLVLAIAYASSPRLRHMLPRYFSAHAFYRESVREGRDVLFVASIILLSSLALAVGIIWVVVLDVWRTTPGFLLVYQLLPRGVEELIITLLAQPLVLLLLVAAVYAASIMLWSVVLALGSRRRYSLAPAQAMMLAIWPRWGVLLLMLAAMVIATMPRDAAFAPSLYLLVAWIGMMAISTARTLYDYYAITRVPIGRIVVSALVNPLVVAAVAVLFLAVEYGPETIYLWHAITRS